MRRTRYTRQDVRRHHGRHTTHARLTRCAHGERNGSAGWPGTTFRPYKVGLRFYLYTLSLSESRAERLYFVLDS